MRLRFEPGRPEYVTAKVYATHEAMGEAYRRDEALFGRTPRGRLRAQALARGREVYHYRQGRMVPAREWGWLMFYRHGITGEVIAHEATHAAIQWARRRRLTGQAVWGRDGAMEGKANERFCYVVGRLVAQFLRAYQRAGFGRLPT